MSSMKHLRVGQRRRTRILSTTTGSKRADTLRPGNSQSFSLQNPVRDSSRYANQNQVEYAHTVLVVPRHTRHRFVRLEREQWDMLLTTVFDPLGGLQNWAKATKITAQMSLGVPFWAARASRRCTRNKRSRSA